MQDIDILLGNRRHCTGVDAKFLHGLKGVSGMFKGAFFSDSVMDFRRAVDADGNG